MRPRLIRRRDHSKDHPQQVVCQARPPARMQSDNATNFTAEIAQELMKPSQVTKVTSTPGHPRGIGLVERQNRTVEPLLARQQEIHELV